MKARRSGSRWVAVGLLVAATAVLTASFSAPPAAAHPSDEVVQQIYVTPAASGLTVQLDLTPGVLVAPRFAATVDGDADGTVSAGEIDAHAAAVHDAVTAQVDGTTVDLIPTERRYPPLDLLTAGGGTVTLVWTAPLPVDAREVTVTDHYDPGVTSTVQTGVLVAPDPVAVGPVRHPDGGRGASLALNAAAAATGGAPAPGAAASSGSPMLDALRRPLTSPWALAALIGACTVLGALHALTPGHGKALLAAYLVGGRGTPGQAIALGSVVTVTHTAAVLALGGAVLAAGPSVVPAAVVPVLTATAGVVVLVLGLHLARRRWTGARLPVADGHGHGHDHGHDHGPARPAGMRGIATMGVSAGMIPCPEALGVLLLAIGLNRTALGLVMIVAFSVGLAAVLVGLGLFLVTAQPSLSRIGGRRLDRVAARVPLLSAVVVAALGAAMTATGMSGVAG